MSVGSSTGWPARIASITRVYWVVSHHASTTRSRPARSSLIADPCIPVPLEHVRRPPALAPRAPRARASRRARRGASRASALGLAVVDERARAAPSRAPPARAPSSSPASTYGGFETTRSNGPGEAVEQVSPRGTRRRARSPPAFSPRERERVGRDVGRVHAGARVLLRRSRARSRRCPCRRRRPAATRSPASSARHRSTTISVSGRGTSARASVFSVSRRKPQSPRT